jgi:hypothetical protein
MLNMLADADTYRVHFQLCINGFQVTFGSHQVLHQKFIPVNSKIKMPQYK